MVAKLLVSALFVTIVGCQTKPTVVHETVSRNFGGSQALLGPIVIDESVVVVDARSSFDYSMARIPRSVSINWADYAETEKNLRGWPQKDAFAGARRLARLGIGLDSKVIVLGNGLEGQGEEGRIAWMLAYWGVSNVRFGRFGSVKARVTAEALPDAAKSNFDDGRPTQPPETPTVSKPIWKPAIVASLIASREEVQGAIENGATEKAWSFAGAKPKIYRIIDVRSEAEYLGKKGGFRAKSIPNINALNAPWKEFFSSDFRPLAETAERLASVGVLPQHRVIVIDNDGVASAAVAMALRAYGYADAGCFAGGYNDLMSR